MVATGPADSPPAQPKKRPAMHALFHHATDSRKRVLVLTLLAFAALC